MGLIFQWRAQHLDSKQRGAGPERRGIILTGTENPQPVNDTKMILTDKYVRLCHPANASCDTKHPPTDEVPITVPHVRGTGITILIKDGSDKFLDRCYNVNGLGLGLTLQPNALTRRLVFSLFLHNCIPFGLIPNLQPTSDRLWSPALSLTSRNHSRGARLTFYYRAHRLRNTLTKRTTRSGQKMEALLDSCSSKPHFSQCGRCAQ
jgi:hypothetical protein